MKFVILIAATVAALLMVVLLWYRDYRVGLAPELVLALPIGECSDLDEMYGATGLARGYVVDKICNSKGIDDGPFFALKGRQAEKFLPDQFHGVHGILQVTDADSETVYFYRYRERYRVIIEMP